MKKVISLTLLSCVLFTGIAFAIVSGVKTDVQQEVSLPVKITVVSTPQYGPTLTVKPKTSNVKLIEGITVNEVIAVVIGGVAPYSYAVDPNSDPFPAGLGYNTDDSGDIILVGIPTATGVSNIVLDITDSAGFTTQLKTKF